jgi:hypothetical protein
MILVAHPASACLNVSEIVTREGKRLQGLTLPEVVTCIIEYDLCSCGFGPQGFKGSLEMLVTSWGSSNDPPNWLSDFREMGISIQGNGHQIRCSLAEWYERENEQPPAWLRRYINNAARNGPPRNKRARPTNRLRDIIIAGEVASACDWTGLPVKRDDASDGDSA